MSETQELARDLVQMVLDAVAKIPRQLVVGKLADVRVDGLTGLISGVSVDIPSGRTECEWLGGFQAEITAHPVSLNGRDCLVVSVDGRFIVQGVIWTGA